MSNKDNEKPRNTRGRFISATELTPQQIQRSKLVDLLERVDKFVGSFEPADRSFIWGEIASHVERRVYETEKAQEVAQ